MQGEVKKVIYFKTKPLAAFKNDILKINIRKCWGLWLSGNYWWNQRKKKCAIIITK